MTSCFFFCRKLYGFRTLKPVYGGLNFHIEAKIHFLQDIDTDDAIRAASLTCFRTGFEKTVQSNRKYQLIRAHTFSQKVLTVG